MPVRRPASSPLPSGAPFGEAPFCVRLGFAPFNFGPPIEESQCPVRRRAADQAVFRKSFPRFEMNCRFGVNDGGMPRAAAFASQEAGWHRSLYFIINIILNLQTEFWSHARESG
jgi:hypothetical protein